MNSAEDRDDFPVLTQVAEEAPAAAAPAVDAPALEALAEHLERTLLERLAPEVERVTAQAADRIRAELTLSVLQQVRDAVAASVSRARDVPKRG
jgi:hypothetical protein